MNYQRPELLSQLAGAYVLGTLRGPARARFDRLCSQDPVVLAALHRWEDRFLPLLPVLTPVTPNKNVWTQIAQRIQGSPAAARPKMPWRRWSLAGALALSLILAVSIRILNPPLQTVAALGQKAAPPMWQVLRTRDSSALTIRALQSVQSNAQNAYELWALPGDGKAPVSLGLLPRIGHIQRSLTPLQQAALLSSNRVAVTLEPAGGSPTGSPTGPVLYVADVVRTG